MHFGGLEIFGSIFITASISLTQSVRMLGAEIVMVVIKLFFDFRHKDTVILLQMPMMAATLILLSLAFLDRDQNHQNYRKVDIKFASVMMPMVFIGWALGEIFHKTMSRIIESSLFVFLLVYMSIACLISSVSYFQENSKLIKMKRTTTDDLVVDSSWELTNDNVEVQEGFTVGIQDEEHSTDTFLIDSDQEDSMNSKFYFQSFLISYIEDEDSETKPIKQGILIILIFL